MVYECIPYDYILHDRYTPVNPYFSPYSLCGRMQSSREDCPSARRAPSVLLRPAHNRRPPDVLRPMRRFDGILSLPGAAHKRNRKPCPDFLPYLFSINITLCTVGHFRHARLNTLHCTFDTALPNPLCPARTHFPADTLSPPTKIRYPHRPPQSPSHRRAYRCPHNGQ